MKKKRTILVAALTFMLFSSVVAMAAAKNQTYSYGSNINASVHGFISFVEGPLVMRDKVYYNAAITGAQRSKCTVAYSVIVDNSVVAYGVLDKNKYSVSVSDKAVGYGHEYAKLQLKFNGKNKILTSYED